MKRPDPNLIKADNFWAKVRKLPNGGCWIWTGAIVNGGYGTFTVGNRTFNAAHVAMTLDGRERPDPPNHVALHGDCSNPSCVNPRHLRWGNQRENIADIFRLGRNADRRGANAGPAKLAVEDVLAIRASSETASDLAAYYGITASNVRCIRRRKTWRNV